MNDPPRTGTTAVKAATSDDEPRQSDIVCVSTTALLFDVRVNPRIWRP